MTKACVMPASTRTWKEGCGVSRRRAVGGSWRGAHLEEDVGGSEDHPDGAAAGEELEQKRREERKRTTSKWGLGDGSGRGRVRLISSG